MRVLGVDLAWSEGDGFSAPNESGVVAADSDGTIAAAGWTRGIEATIDWIETHSTANTLVMIDAPLVVTNDVGQRLCDKQVGQRYGRWKVSANSINLGSPMLSGQRLRLLLEANGWSYSAGFDGPPTGGRVFSECYPYTCLVGAEELGYDIERPMYKRKPKGIATADFRPLRAQACDELIRRAERLDQVDPPLRLRSHAVTATLPEEPSPLNDRAYKHREDLLDAALCAWTGLLWLRFGSRRCQVLGDPSEEPAAGMIAPARAAQRAAAVRPPRRSSPRPTVTRTPSPASTSSGIRQRGAVADLECRCGCGGTRSLRANFLPGHDAKLLSQVLRGHKPLAVLDDFPLLRDKAMRTMGS